MDIQEIKKCERCEKKEIDAGYYCEECTEIVGYEQWCIEMGERGLSEYI